jgi:predicted NUDIX family phosphoesterase/dephospho-CoA kinase
MQARLSIDILNNPQTPFARVSKGRFYLKEGLGGAPNDNLVEGGVLEEYTAIRREAVESHEMVLSIPRTSYAPFLDFQGIGRFGFQNPLQFLSPHNTVYQPRVLAETLDNYKQIVTYAVIQHKSKILSFRRGQYNRAASFLRGAFCVGFGGHVTDQDNTLFSFKDQGIRQNAAREIWEELVLPNGRPQIDPDSFEYLGVLNDDSSDVGVRHVAIVLRYWADDWDEWRRVKRGEASVSKLGWIDTAGEQINLSDYEYWSQLVIRKFYPSSLSMTPSFKLLRKEIFRQPHVLCVVGSIGSGKSATTKFLKARCKYTEVNSGRVVAALLGIPPVPKTSRSEFQMRAHDFITDPKGPQILGQALATAAHATNSQRVIIDGVRHPETLEALRGASRLPVALLYVYTPPDVAFEMYKRREDYGEKNTSFDEFVRLYNAPVESRVRYLLGDADVISFNWLGETVYMQSLERLAESIYG